METTPRNKLAVWSLVLSIFLFTFVAAILGHIALGQIKKSGGGGRGLALSGVIIGWLTTVFFFIPLLAVFIAPEASGYLVGVMLGYANR